MHDVIRSRDVIGHVTIRLRRFAAYMSSVLDIKPA